MIDRFDGNQLSGDELARVLSALANRHRLRIVATLATGTVHVSQLAREVGLSRPLVHMHLQRLEAAGLVRGRLELSEDGKAMRFYEVTPFAIDLTPELVVAAARTLSAEPDQTKETP
jgi:ArsR family transcriptional regulator, zinc-responsive transcriptional repressor